MGPARAGPRLRWRRCSACSEACSTSSFRSTRRPRLRRESAHAATARAASAANRFALHRFPLRAGGTLGLSLARPVAPCCRAFLFLPMRVQHTRRPCSRADLRALLRADIRRVKVPGGSPSAASMGPSVDASFMDFAAGAAMAGESSLACAKASARLSVLSRNQLWVRRRCPGLSGCK